MKLTDLTIREYGVCQNVTLENLSDNVSLIHGPNGSGKTTIREFIQDVLFGNSEIPSHFDARHPMGSCEIQVGEQKIRVSREAHTSGLPHFERIHADATLAAIPAPGGLDSTAFRRCLASGSGNRGTTFPRSFHCCVTVLGRKEIHGGAMSRSS